MLSNIFSVAGLLVIGIIFITLWVGYRQWMAGAVPPGQYPLDKVRPEWPGQERILPYRPSRDMGSDAFVSTEGADTKAKCAMMTSCDA